MRLLSFSSASSPQAPVLTASNGRCMLPSAVVLHSEACFARQKHPREKNSTPPKWPPRTDNKSLRDSPHPVQLGQSMDLSMALKVASSSPPTLRSHLLSQLNLVCFEWSQHITVQSSNKQKSLRAYCARNHCSTHAHALQEVAKMQPFVTQRVMGLHAISSRL